MERRLNLLFGIIGGLFLVLLSPALNLYPAFGNLFLGMEFIRDIVAIFFAFISATGFVIMSCFSILLIIDSIKLVRKR